MLFLQAAKRNPEARGFIQLELAAAAFLLLLAWGVTFAGDACLRQYRRMQVRAAAAVLALDIRAEQRQAMFEDGILNRHISVLADNEGYAFYKNRKVVGKINFALKGCEGVYFARKIAQAQFTNTGSPSATGSYELRHRKLEGFNCTVAIQPVTGRVVITEGG